MFYVAGLIALGIALSQMCLNGNGFTPLYFALSLILSFIAFIDLKTVPFTVLKFGAALLTIFFFPIPGFLYLAAIGIPYLTQDVILRSLTGLLVPLSVITLRGGEFLFTRDTISLALMIWGAYLITLKPTDIRVSFAGLIVSIIGSATLETFMVLFPAQIMMLIGILMNRSSPDSTLLTANVFLVLNSWGGLIFALFPYIKTLNDRLIRWLS